MESGKLKETKNKSKWQALIFLSVILILGMSTQFSAAAVLPQLRSLWDLSSGSAAWLTISVQVGFIVGALVSSFLNLSDLVSARHVIFTGGIGSAVVNLLLLRASSGGAGILLRFMTGFFLAGVYPPAFKLMSTWFRESRGLALGLLAASIVIGNGLPHLVNGLGGVDWRTVIVMTSVFSIIAGLIAEFAVNEGPFPFPRSIFNPLQAKDVFSNQGVRLAVFGYIGHMWELFAMYAWIAVFFSESLSLQGISNATYSSFATFFVFVAGGFGCWVGGVLADRWSRTHSTILMMALSGSCAILIGHFYGRSIFAIILISLFWGFSIVADSAQFSTLVTELADQSYVGTALTLQLAAGFLVSGVTIWLVPGLQKIFGWKWTFAFLAPGPLLGIFSMLRLNTLLERKKNAFTSS